MKCNRCNIQIPRDDPFVVFYARFTTGQKQTFVFCKECAGKFAAFIKEGKPDKTKKPEDQ